MSDSSASAQSGQFGSSSFPSGEHEYVLHSELARMCLPSEYKDTNRLLAWVNSICLLFLLIGLVGLKEPQLITRPLSQVIEPMAPVILQAEEQPKVREEVKPEDETPPEDTPTDVPQVAPIVVAAADANVRFSIPVQGPVVVAQNPVAAPPPPRITQAPRAPAKPTVFQPAAGDTAHPPPNYPASALRNRYQGTVTIEIVVAPSGTITSAQVLKTSGFSMLDQAALEVVQQRWKFPPGPERIFHWPCVFKMQ